MKTIEEIKKLTDIPVVATDEQGNINFINKAFGEVFGWQKEEIIGRPLTTIIPPNLRDAHRLGFSRFLATKKPTLLNQPLNLKAIKKDGVIFDAEHLILAEQRGGHWIFGATIQPLK